MRPTKPLSKASRRPGSDPVTSLLLVVVLFASFVAVSYPVATAVLAVLSVTAVVVKRTVRVTGNGYLCIPELDRCYRLVPN